MADTPNDTEQPSASDSNGEAEAAKRPAAKKKTVKKAAAKKTVSKEKTTKKTATAPASAAPPVASASVPQWDDDQGGIGLVGTLVQWGPVLLIIALIFVLDSEDANGSHASSESSNSTEAVAANALASDWSTGGTIELSENIDAWSLGNSGDGSENTALGLGTTSNVNWLEDPAAFYWGPAIVDEFPPAPSSSGSN